MTMDVPRGFYDPDWDRGLDEDYETPPDFMPSAGFWTDRPYDAAALLHARTLVRMACRTLGTSFEPHLMRWGAPRVAARALADVIEHARRHTTMHDDLRFSDIEAEAVGLLAVARVAEAASIRFVEDPNNAVSELAARGNRDSAMALLDLVAAAERAVERLRGDVDLVDELVAAKDAARLTLGQKVYNAAVAEGFRLAEPALGAAEASPAPGAR